jgi:REP element-mobilizing transposase RayT
MGNLNYRPSYRRNLPHIQPLGETFFLTFRLAGSLPQIVVDQWNEERQWLNHLKQNNPLHHELVKSDFDRAWFIKFEALLDGGEYGPVWLKEDRIAAKVAESLHHRDGKVYRLDAFSIMPNHVHVVFKPLPAGPAGSELSQVDGFRYHSLAAIMQSLKGYTAYQANRLLDRDGEFWAHESYDHYVRDADEWKRIVTYVLSNPVKARYVDNWRVWKWNYRRL